MHALPGAERAPRAGSAGRTSRNGRVSPRGPSAVCHAGETGDGLG